MAKWFSTHRSVMRSQFSVHGVGVLGTGFDHLTTTNHSQFPRRVLGGAGDSRGPFRAFCRLEHKTQLLVAPANVRYGPKAGV